MPERASVAYLLKAYPRASETFILSEIERLERAGLPLRLYAIKPAEAGDSLPRHPVVDRIRARPEFLTPVTSVKLEPLHRWIVTNLRRYRPILARVARRRPLGLARAAAAALAQAFRDRDRRLALPQRKYAKEFLQAVALADQLLLTPEVQHLHAHYAHSTTTVAWLASMIRGVSFSFTGHARDIYCESLNPAGLLRRKLGAARFAVTCTEANRRFLRQVSARTPVHRLYHGLNVDFGPPIAASGVSSRSNPLILGVGRMVAKKGFDVLVEAAAQLHRRQPGFEVLIIGGAGEHTSLVRDRITERGLERVVRMSGPMDQASLYREYRRASVFCLPCRILDDGDRDGIPNVLVEAMAAGIPVVTTRVSGIPELVVDGVNGLLVPSDDAAATAAALHRVISDPALARRLGRAGRETVRERFDGDRLARHLAGLFREVIA